MDDRLKHALSAVTERQSGRNLIDAGRIESASQMGKAVTVILAPPVAGKPDLETLKPAIEKALTAVDGVEEVRVIMTAHREAAQKPQTGHNHQKPAPVEKPATHVLVVASGKGGVGKSTVAANIAAALSRDGLKVGMMDADIYGPSVPRLFGINNAPGLKKTDTGVQPVIAHGIKLISMGFLLEPGMPVVWRGPMVQGAIRQFMTDTNWGELDVLIIDMPPGTGDAQLAVAQELPVDGAIIVSTPQDLALDDARKAITMFEKTHVPVLGIVENMSVFICPHCGEGSHIFGHGGAREVAKSIKTEFLGEIPLHPELRERSDTGRPVALDEGPVGDAFLKTARAALEAADAVSKPAPGISFD